MDDPTTWSADDPARWMHEEWYRKRHHIPEDAVIPGLAPLPNEDSPRVDDGRNYHQVPGYADDVYRIAGKDVTKMELLSRLKDTKRSVSEEYFMKKNGDPLGDLQADWYEELKEFLDVPADVDEDDPFTLWTAKQHYKLDMMIENKLAKPTNSNVSSVAGSETTASTSKRPENLKTTRKLQKCMPPKKKKIDDKNQKELEMDLEEMKKVVPKLKQKFLKVGRAFRQGEPRKSEEYHSMKNDLDLIIKDIKMLYTVAQRFSK